MTSMATRSRRCGSTCRWTSSSLRSAARPNQKWPVPRAESAPLERGRPAVRVDDRRPQDVVARDGAPACAGERGGHPPARTFWTAAGGRSKTMTSPKASSEQRGRRAGAGLPLASVRPSTPRPHTVPIIAAKRPGGVTVTSARSTAVAGVPPSRARPRAARSATPPGLQLAALLPAPGRRERRRAPRSAPPGRDGGAGAGPPRPAPAAARRRRARGCARRGAPTRR